MSAAKFCFNTLCFLSLVLAAVEDFSTWDHIRVDLGNVSIHARYAGIGPPLVLVHGYPQHSISWSTIGPILASQNYTVIAPDLRGMGDSGLPQNSDAYDALTCATDIAGVLRFLNISTTFVFGHDKGGGVTAALVANFRDKGLTFPRFGIAEYPLPGFGYEGFQDPTSTQNLYNNWQLAFFSIVDAAQFFIQGREREMLSWYFFHSSYSGTSAIQPDILTQYADPISKPGFLRSGLSLFSNANIATDAAFFNSTLGKTPFQQPMLALGGEASFSPKATLDKIFTPIAANLTSDVVPKAGHWILDENPEWVSSRLLEFFEPAKSSVPAVDLSYLSNKVTLGAGPVYRR